MVNQHQTLHGQDSLITELSTCHGLTLQGKMQESTIVLQIMGWERQRQEMSGLMSNLSVAIYSAEIRDLLTAMITALGMHNYYFAFFYVPLF